MNSLLSRAMRILSQRDYSEAEMRRKLLTAHSSFRGREEQEPVSADDVNSVIEYCRQHGWLNDTGYAQKFVESRSRKGYGPQRIQFEMQQKGISQEEASAALASCDIDWFEIARDVAAKKAGRAMPTDWKEKAKLQRHLAQRGFRQDEIRAVFSDSEY
ncbi:regulatory protein RecX [Leminorella grimontii]|uniref:regulatory protein RecX n=1 Tax=Leminorella grimontii TaxID=82981 RepID=UPI00322062A5